MKQANKNFGKSWIDELDDLTNADGSFTVENLGGQAILSIKPPQSLKGKSVELNDVLARLSLLKIKDFDEKQIKQIVDNANGNAHVIGRWPGGLPENSFPHIRLSNDKMTAWLKIQPPLNGGKPISRERIELSLESLNIRYGVDTKLLDALIKDPVYNEELVIAQGKRPKAGRQGYIDLKFDSPHKISLKEDEQGRVDYKQIDFIKTVAKGDVIAERIDPEEGSEGINLHGETIPANSGKKAEWRLGHNVTLIDQGARAVAAITGRPIADKHGIISVDEMIRLNEVDYSTGNINFTGTIIVEEGIAEGFKLVTEGSIIVKKSIGKVFLKAKKDIILSGGFMGRDIGSIEAGQDIYARFIERGRMHAGGSIYISEAAMHSELNAQNAIIIQGKRGDMIGGKALAGSHFVCSKLGAVVETKTSIVIGTPPDTWKALSDLQKTISEKIETLFKIRQTLQHLQTQSEKRDLNEEELTMQQKLLAVEGKYQNNLQNEEQQYDTILANFESNPESFLLVQEELYHNVDVFFGKDRVFHSPIRPTHGPIYLFWHDGKITQDYKPPHKNKTVEGSWNAEKEKAERAAELEK